MSLLAGGKLPNAVILFDCLQLYGAESLDSAGNETFDGFLVVVVVFFFSIVSVELKKQEVVDFVLLFG